MIHPAEWFLLPAVRERLTLMEEVVWDRGSTHNHSNRLMWPQTERLYVFRRTDGTYSLANDNRLTYRSDLWRIALNPRMPSSTGHNAPFVDQLAEAVIETWSRPGDLVCDPYSGSGTTGVAAQRLGRDFAGSERLKKYYDIARERLAA
jgi:DNA modification methylase